MLGEIREKRWALVVATRNRPDQLRRFVDSLMNQESQYIFCLIVVDQSDGDLIYRNQSVLEKVSLWPTYHVLLGERGLSRARNAGLKHLVTLVKDPEALYLAFPDDDCLYPSGLLEEATKLFDSKPSCDFLAGVYGDETGLHPKFSHRQQRVSMWNVFSLISSSALFFRGRVLPHLVFDESLGAGSLLPAGEEIDLILRLLRKGYKGCYHPSLRVYHKVLRFSQANLKDLLAREAANAFVLARSFKATPNIPLGVRLLGRIAKDYFRLLKPDNRALVKARWEGYLWGWKGRGPE